MPEEKALNYLYQCSGIVPWVGIDKANGPAKPFGGSFYQVTEKGLSRERGYVGGYGEGGLEGVMDCYEATRGADGEGDAKLKAQLVKMFHARAPFRYPMLDAEKHPAMLLETAVGWRDTHLPGPIIYAQRGGADHSILQIVTATMDPQGIGYVQQMFEDNQFFASIAEQLKNKNFRTTVGMLETPGDYELLKSQPANSYRLPMSWDQPDFVFSDEEDGVVAIKNDKEILYASLYWRAGFGINSLARTHYLTPNYQQVAVVHEDNVKFEPSGETFTRKDWINFGFGNGGTYIQYPGDVHQAFAGEELPIAKAPEDVKSKPGEESYFAGKAEFYTLRFGPYLIGMNTTKDKTFDMTVPAGAQPARELVSKRKNVEPGSTQKVGPRSTVVFYFPR
jgi:hypothetical protein